MTPPQVTVGQSVTYTYQITNSGNVTLATVSAVVEGVGAVADLAGELAPNATRIATVVEVVTGLDYRAPDPWSPPG